MVGPINYINYNSIITKDAINSEGKEAFFQKHIAFHHENEFRVLANLDEDEDDKNLKYLLLELQKDISFEVFSSPRMSELNHNINKEYKKKIMI
jgi:hypothetical protein